MKVAVLGSGIVGQTLATAFLKEGYEVTLSSRTISKPEMIDWKTKNLQEILLCLLMQLYGVN